MGICYIVHNLVINYPISKYHFLAFTIISSLPLPLPLPLPFSDNELDGMAGILFLFIPVGTAAIVLLTVAILGLKALFVWCFKKP